MVASPDNKSISDEAQKITTQFEFSDDNIRKCVAQFTVKMSKANVFETRILEERLQWEWLAYIRSQPTSRE